MITHWINGPQVSSLHTSTKHLAISNASFSYQLSRLLYRWPFHSFVCYSPLLKDTHIDHCERLVSGQATLKTLIRVMRRTWPTTRRRHLEDTHKERSDLWSLQYWDTFDNISDISEQQSQHLKWPFNKEQQGTAFGILAMFLDYIYYNNNWVYLTCIFLPII